MFFINRIEIIQYSIQEYDMSGGTEKKRLEGSQIMESNGGLMASKTDNKQSEINGKLCKGQHFFTSLSVLLKSERNLQTLSIQQYASLMTSESSYDNNSLNDEYDQQQAFRNRFKKQASEALNSLDYHQHQNRLLLSSSFRSLTRQLKKVEQDRFNLNDGEDMIGEIAKSSYFYRPYDILNKQFKFNSFIWRGQEMGGRKCKEPLIKIDHQVVDFQGKNQRIVIKEKPFLLVIQAQPNSVIIYTNKPRTHPLLIFSKEECEGYFKEIKYQKCEELLAPPVELSIIVVKDQLKIQSKLMCLKVISNQSEESKNRMFQMGWAIRPEQSFNYQDSASGNAISYSMNEESL